LGVGGGWSEREGWSAIFAKIYLRLPPFLCVQVDKASRIRERERGQPARLPPGRVCKEKEEERKRKEEVVVNLAKFRLNFEKCKVFIQWW
jgi:hypothetical protein